MFYGAGSGSLAAVMNAGAAAAYLEKEFSRFYVFSKIRVRCELCL